MTTTNSGLNDEYEKKNYFNKRTKKYNKKNEDQIEKNYILQIMIEG